MNSLAELWVLSGEKPGRLYQGGTEEIVVKLKAWVERRKTNNSKNMAGIGDMFCGFDSLEEVIYQPEGSQQIPASEIEDRLAADRFAATTHTQMRILNRLVILRKKRDKEDVLANFFLASLRRRGLRWPQTPFTGGNQTDACVCAFLGTVDQGFNAEKELEILKAIGPVAQPRNEPRRRDATRAREIANNPIPGVNAQPTRLLTARFGEAVAYDPTKPTVQAIKEVAGTISTSKTTGETTCVVAEHSPPSDNTATHIKGMLGNLHVAARDEVRKASKAKKKREGRKRAKARAKQAATSAGDSADSYNDEDGEAPGIVNV